MKKIILALGVVAAACGFTACNGGSDNQSNEDKALSDSLGTAFGTFVGKQMEMQVASMKMQLGDKFDEAQFKQGIESALKMDTANISKIIGMQVGQQLISQIYQWNQQGVKVNPEVVSRAFIKAMGDTAINGQDAYAQYQILSGRVMEKAREKQDEANARLAEENIAAGQKYVADLQAKDPEVKSTESGLAYKIIAQGDGKVADHSNVSVIYTGKHIDGSVFDSSEGNPTEFNVDGVVAGFAEGLKLLGKGGKATLYIPGELAYGPQGQPRANIGPNEMLVFDVEVVDFSAPEE